MPGLFEQFPHTNLHELNLDWLIDMLNQFKEELENSAVLSVNGQTGHVTLYESENVILPPLPSGVDQWRLVRLVNGQYAGILFYNNHAYIQRGNETMRLLTLEDIPTSAGVVSWNGLTGVVNVTGEDIPVDDTADADSIAQAITNEHTERVNADNALQNSLNGKLTHRRVPGTYTNQEIVGVYGFCTTGANHLYLYIPMIFQADVSGVNVTNILLGLRTSTGGYVGGTDNFDASDYIIGSANYNTQGIILVHLLKNDGWGANNNTCFAGRCTMSYTIR